MNKEINERIKYYRKLKKYTQEDVAKALGKKSSTYSQMERRGKNISTKDIKAIAEFLDIDPDLIFYGDKLPDLTPIEPEPIIFEDPSKSNPALPKEPEIVVAYKCGEFEISNEEKNLVKIYRNLDEPEKQKVRDFILGKKYL